MRKTLLVLPGYLVGLGGLVLITYRTLVAVLSGSKSVTVQVNRFGEQYVDIVCLVFLWVVCVVGVVSLWLVVREKTPEMQNDREGNREFGVRLPTLSVDGVSHSFSDGPSVSIVVMVDDSFVRMSPIFPPIIHQTNGEWSFSVQVVSDAAEDENRY